MSGSILVVGAGVAGRSVARALARNGVDCIVVERRGKATGLGMGLNLPGNATRALAELGVVDHVVAHGVPVRRREYHNGAGRLLFSVEDEEFWRGVGPPVCLRHGRLLEALALPPPALAFETGNVTAARLTSEGVEVELEGRPRRFDFVIGADGVHSALRGAVAPGELRPSLMTGSCWRFVVDAPDIDCWTVWSGRTATLLLIPVERDRVYGYAASTRGEPTGADPEWLSRAFAGFPRPATDVIDRVLAGEGDLRHDAVSEVHVERWHRGRLVLIGDAAHATGPVWAQGAALAMEDALTLADILVRTPATDWGEVGTEFERIRRPRIEHVRAATDRMSRLARLPGWVRDLSAPVLGPRAYREAYRPLRNALPPSQPLEVRTGTATPATRWAEEDDGPMHSESTTVDDYLASLSEARRTPIAAVRDTVNEHLPDGYEERMDWGMISWVVPLEAYPATYNKKPLCYAALASQKQHMAVYLMGLYTDGPEAEWFRGQYAERGLRLDMGKSCVRFKSLDDLPLDVLGEAIAMIPVGEFIARYEASRQR